MRAAITGAAAGIGRALAERLARDGHGVLGIDVDGAGAQRTAAALVELGGEASFVTADLATADGVERALAALRRAAPVDLLVHSAGTSCVGRFDASEWLEQRRVVELNLVAPMHLTAAVLREGLLAPRGTLVFVSSLSRFVGYPGAAGYAASKDGLASYARSLRTELAARGVNVLTVYPGPTRTEHARLFAPPGAREDRRMSPEALATRIERAVARRRRVLVPGAANRVAAALGHVLPGVVERAMKRTILDRLPGPLPSPRPGERGAQESRAASLRSQS